MKPRAARLASPTEIKATAKRMKTTTRGFGHAKSEKYARESKKRLDAFVKKVGR